MPPRSAPPPRPNKFLPYLAFILFSAIFVFKLDVIISQKIFAARREKEISATREFVEVASPPPFMVENGTFNRLFLVTWGERNARIMENGELLTLGLDKKSGSGFQSRKELLFGRIDMQIKLIHGNAAGTVTTYYPGGSTIRKCLLIRNWNLFENDLDMSYYANWKCYLYYSFDIRMPQFSSEGDHHDEIDFEFLGNSSGNPYTLHTNVFSQGKGDREQQFFLWFDPTKDFHIYSILWNTKSIIWYVDNIPIREFKNAERLRVPFPKDQPMRVYSSIWNADEWATQGGKVKTDWKLAPFTASYRNFSLEGCIWSRLTRSSSCTPEDLVTKSVMKVELDRISRAKMKRLQQKHMVYDYCRDKWRFPKGPAPECRIN